MPSIMCPLKWVNFKITIYMNKYTLEKDTRAHTAHKDNNYKTYDRPTSTQ